MDCFADLAKCDVVVLLAERTFVDVADLLVLANQDHHGLIIAIP